MERDSGTWLLLRPDAAARWGRLRGGGRLVVVEMQRWAGWTEQAPVALADRMDSDGGNS
jgi:hypothetical protein